jgi:hypothetical protein
MAANSIHTHLTSDHCQFPASGGIMKSPDLGGKIQNWGPTTPTNTTAGYPKGSLFQNTTDGKLYINTGTAASCTFEEVGQETTELAATAITDWPRRQIIVPHTTFTMIDGTPLPKYVTSSAPIGFAVNNSKEPCIKWDASDTTAIISSIHFGRILDRASDVILYAFLELESNAGRINFAAFPWSINDANNTGITLVPQFVDLSTSIDAGRTTITIDNTPSGKLLGESSSPFTGHLSFTLTPSSNTGVIAFYGMMVEYQVATGEDA